jgi:hypothetical protein
MATYFEGGVDYFPKQTLFTPNWNLVQNVLETKQSQYDKGFEKIRSLATSMMNSPMLNEQAKERRDQYMKVAEDSLKNLPNLDLSLYQNVSAATNVFKPVYDDQYITSDIYKARTQSAEVKRGLALRDSDKEEERKRYWNEGIQDLQDWADDYSKADLSTAMGMNPRRFVAKPQVGEQVLKMFNDGKIKMSKDRLSGMYKYTDENGRQLRTPITNLFIGMAQNDPEALQGFQVYGRVERNRFLREKTADGTYATKEEAAKYYDEQLVQNHQKRLNKSIAVTETNIGGLEKKIADWKVKLASGSITDQAEFDQAIQDAAELKQLQFQKTEYQDQLKTAPINIKNDPERYVGQVYMHKSASDLAEALSEFGTLKIDSNPIYKDFVFPIELENLKAKNAEALARLNSQLKREEDALKKDNENEDGTSSSSGTGKSKKSDATVTKKQMDVPIVSDNIAGSGVLKKDPEGQADAYQYNIDVKNDIVRRHGNAMFDFIEKTYGADPWIDPSTGKQMTLQEKKDLLQKGGTKLSSLYQAALSKYDDIVKVNNPKNLNLINELSEIKERKDRLNDVWDLADVYLTNKRTELVEYLKGTSVIPGSSFLYDFLLEGGNTYKALLGSTDQDINKFIEKIKKTPRYKDELAAYAYANGQYDDPSLGYITMGQGANWITIPGIAGKIWNFGKDLRPMLGQTPYPKIPLSDDLAEEGLTKEYKKAFTALRGEFLKTWNKNGWLFTTENIAKGGAGGGGLYAKAITFTGSAKIQGEQADVLTEDFIGKASGFVGDTDNFRVVEGTIEAGEVPEDDDDARKTLFGEILPELTKSIKAGDAAAVSTYNITYSPIGGNDPNYHAYTFSLNLDKVDKETGEVKPGAKRENITVYIKNDKDNTLFSARSSIGEIEYAMKTSKTGNISKEVRPGYKVDLNEQARGNYTMTITYPEINQTTGEETPRTKIIDVPATGDITTIYYGAIRNLKGAYDFAQQVQQNVTEAKKTKPDTKVYTVKDFEEALQQIQ